MYISLIFSSDIKCVELITHFLETTLIFVNLLVILYFL